MLGLTVDFGSNASWTRVLARRSVHVENVVERLGSILRVSNWPTEQTTRTFLVVDSFEEMRLLVVRTLRRVFPDALITEAHDFEEAIRLTSSNAYDAIVVHRAIGADAKSIIELIRRDNAVVPIVAVSSMDRTDEVLSAGATAFLNFEEWLRVGTLVAELVGESVTRHRGVSRRSRLDDAAGNRFGPG